jgi:hypothetical protein
MALSSSILSLSGRSFKLYFFAKQKNKKLIRIRENSFDVFIIYYGRAQWTQRQSNKFLFSRMRMSFLFFCFAKK